MENNKNELWYFAHPFTGYGENKYMIEAVNYRICIIRTCLLIEAGYTVFSPILHSYPIETNSIKALHLPPVDRHIFLMNIDKTIIKRTNFTGIIFAPGWQDSVGCKIEYDIFRKTNKKIFYYEDIIKNGI